MRKIAIIGSGSWGIALATHLARCGNEIKIWSFSEKEMKLINEERRCEFLPGLEIDENITCYNEFEETIKDTEFILHVTPSLNNINNMLEMNQLLYVRRVLKNKV